MEILCLPRSSHIPCHACHGHGSHDTCELRLLVDIIIDLRLHPSASTCREARAPRTLVPSSDDVERHLHLSAASTPPSAMGRSRWRPSCMQVKGFLRGRQSCGLLPQVYWQVKMPTTEIAGFPLIDGATIMASIDNDTKCEAALRIREWSDSIRRQKCYHAASYGTVSEGPSDLVAIISMRRITCGELFVMSS